MILEEDERFYSLDVALAYCVGKQVIWKESPNCICHGSCQFVADEKNPACPICRDSTRGWTVRGRLLPRTAEEAFVLSQILPAKANPIIGDHGRFQVRNIFYGVLAVPWSISGYHCSTACKRSLFLHARVAIVTLLMLPSFSGTFLSPSPAPLWAAGTLAHSTPSAQKLLACWWICSSSHSLSNASGLFLQLCRAHSMNGDDKG